MTDRTKVARTAEGSILSGGQKPRSKSGRLRNWAIVELAGRREMGYVWGMTVEAIKEAIAGLPDEERHSLAAWLNELDYDEWDKETVRPSRRAVAAITRWNG
jgi:hypothetical protein